MKKSQPSDTRKRGVNPYLFLLLKEMFAFEVSYFFGKDTYLNSCRYLSIASRKPLHPKEVKALVDISERNPDYPDDTTSFAKRLWGNKTDFSFTKQLLDKLASSILFLDDFESWESFVLKYSNYGFSKSVVSWSEQFMNKTYEQIKDDGALNVINRMVTQQLGKIVHKAFANGKFAGKSYNNVVTLSDGCTLRSADIDDLKTVETRKKELYPDDLTEIMNKHKFEQFELFFYVFLDQMDTISGFFGLIPIAYQSYEDLFLGKIESTQLKTVSPYSSTFIFADLFYLDDYFRKMIEENLIDVLTTFAHRNSQKKDAKRSINFLSPTTRYIEICSPYKSKYLDFTFYSKAYQEQINNLIKSGQLHNPVELFSEIGLPFLGMKQKPRLKQESKSNNLLTGKILLKGEINT